MNEWIYLDVESRPALKTVRVDKGLSKKRFIQYYSDKGKWVAGGAKVEIQPYNYQSWKDKEYVFFVEGEKCACALIKLGVQATTIPGGANAWKQRYANYFNGKKIILLPDNDKPGRDFIKSTYEDIKHLCKEVKILELPNLKEKEDVYDWVERGGTREELFSLCKLTIDSESVLSSWDDSTVESTLPRDKVINQWPELKSEAFYGLAGEIVKKIAPHTESDISAILIQFLVAFGNIIGRHSYYQVERTKHYANLFTVIVGDSSKARKGTSWNQVLALYKQVDEEWVSKKIQRGLSSGEGLAEAVKDASEKIVKGELVTEPGVDDKRLLAVESEFCSVLSNFERSGNTLSARLRDAWDHGNFQSLTKGSPISATNAHISNIGHITIHELKKKLSETDMANGLGNRYLFNCARRSQNLPFGGEIDSVDFTGEIIRLKAAIEAASQPKRVQWDEEARLDWQAAYNDLSKVKYSGLLGSITSRGEAQVVRLSMIYALLDCSPEITPQHLYAALAIWEYSEESCKYIFGESTGNPLAEEILVNLKQVTLGLTKTEIAKLFNNHKSKIEIDNALQALLQLSLVKKETRPTKGRSVEAWVYQK